MDIHGKTKPKSTIISKLVGRIAFLISPRYRFVNYIKFSRHLRITGISASAMLIAIMTLTICPIVNTTMVAEAAPGVATASTTTLTMESGYNNANLSLLVGSNNGTFSSSSDDESAKFSIKTNNYTGYTLSISSASDNGQLINSRVINNSEATGDSPTTASSCIGYNN